MRKISGLLFLTLLMGIALWLYYGRKDSSYPLPPSVTVPTQSERGEDQSAQVRSETAPAEAVQDFPVGARKPLPALDTASPVYQSALVLLENRFIRMLERETQAEPWPPEQLVEVANRLAKLQLAQAMHEASIANYTLVGNKAVIVIPAYPREGEAFQTAVRALLPSDFGSEGFKRELVQRFGHFGRYAQQLEVRSVVRIMADGQSVKHYEIVHRFEMDVGSSVGVSQLTDIYLGPYAPFIGAFPKE